jgi:hypothetical protein
MIQFENAINYYRKIILEDFKEAGITAWVAGGSVRDYFMGTKMKTDHDIFFPDLINFEKAKLFFESKEAEVKWESDNGLKVNYNGRIFDLIKLCFPDPQTTIDNFDFTVAMFAVDYDKVYHGETSFIDLSKRQLMIHNLNFPPSTLSRAFRYYEKGFRMCLMEMKKLVEAIQEMPKVEDKEGSETDDNRPPSGTGDFFRGID